MRIWRRNGNLRKRRGRLRDRGRLGDRFRRKVVKRGRNISLNQILGARREIQSLISTLLLYWSLKTAQTVTHLLEITNLVP